MLLNGWGLLLEGAKSALYRPSLLLQIVLSGKANVKNHDVTNKCIIIFKL